MTFEPTEKAKQMIAFSWWVGSIGLVLFIALYSWAAPPTEFLWACVALGVAWFVALILSTRKYVCNNPVLRILTAMLQVACLIVGFQVIAEHFLPSCVGSSCTPPTTMRHAMRYQGLVVVILVGCALVLTFRRLFYRRLPDTAI